MIRQVLNYLNNKNLKASGVQVQYTPEQAEEYLKCYDDPKYFIQKFVRIVHVDRGIIPFEMFEWQKEYTDLIHENRFTIARVARQSGKCFSFDTKIKLRNKKTNQIVETTIGEFFNLTANLSRK